jgi:hypothetical protein
MGRNKEIKIRLTDAEHEQLMQKRNKMRLAAWMRETCIRGQPPVIPQINQEALAQLRGIATNINQIAHRLNGGASIDLDDLHSEVSALRAVLAGALTK